MAKINISSEQTELNEVKNVLNKIKQVVTYF